MLIVGEVAEAERLAHAGHAAELVVERQLRGEEGAPLAMGDRIELVWEEPSAKLPGRLRRGERLVVAVEAGPTASIWKQRVPNAERRRRLRSIGARGEGYVRRPGADSLDSLEHYLALTTAARSGEAGTVYLTRLAAAAPPRLALDALERLQADPSRTQEIPPAGAQALLAVLLRSGAEDVVSAAIRLVEVARPPALAPLLAARIGAMGDAVPLPLLAARAALEGGLPDDMTRRMAASASEADRLAAARWAAGPKGASELRVRLTSDRSPAVREAALRRLVSLEGIAATDEAVHGLGDAAPNVRRVAVESLARFGPEVIPDLRRAVDRGSTDASLAAVAAISMIPGEASRRELEDLADNHADPGVRSLAELALHGTLGGHEH